MTPDELLDQIIAGVRTSLPKWVPQEALDAYLKENRAALAARLAATRPPLPFPSYPETSRTILSALPENRADLTRMARGFIRDGLTDYFIADRLSDILDDAEGVPTYTQPLGPMGLRR